MACVAASVTKYRFSNARTTACGKVFAVAGSEDSLGWRRVVEGRGSMGSVGGSLAPSGRERRRKALPVTPRADGTSVLWALL